MEKEELRQRTKVFALRVMKMTGALPKSPAGRTIGGQIVRSATSVGANYRAALRARSRNEFIAKLCIVLEEIDESCYWLELIVEGQLLKNHLLHDLCSEANELTAIFAASVKSARIRAKKS